MQSWDKNSRRWDLLGKGFPVGNEAEQGATQVCNLSRSLASACPHRELWSPNHTTEPGLTWTREPAFCPHCQLAVGKEAGPEEGYHRPGRQPISDLYLNNSPKKGTALSWLLSIFIVAIILCFVPRWEMSYFQSLNISSLKEVKILL